VVCSQLGGFLIFGLIQPAKVFCQASLRLHVAWLLARFAPCIRTSLTTCLPRGRTTMCASTGMYGKCVALQRQIGRR
jgi:hypothetical protein